MVRALDAVLVEDGPGGRMEIPSRDFFPTHLTTDLGAEELLVELRFPRATHRRLVPGGGPQAWRLRPVGLAAPVILAGGVLSDVRIRLTGVASVPYRGTEAESVPTGHTPEPAVPARAADAVRDAIEPGDALHATAGHRRGVAGVLLPRAVTMAARHAEENAENAEMRSRTLTRAPYWPPETVPSGDEVVIPGQPSDV